MTEYDVLRVYLFRFKIVLEGNRTIAKLKCVIENPDIG